MSEMPDPIYSAGLEKLRPLNRNLVAKQNSSTNLFLNIRSLQNLVEKPSLI